MWVVQPEFKGNRCCTLDIIYLNCVARAVHLLPVYGSSFLPEDFHFSDSLDGIGCLSCTELSSSRLLFIHLHVYVMGFLGSIGPP